MKTLLFISLVVAGFIFTPSSSEAMCYYNRNVDCLYNVRWRPHAFFASDKLWQVKKGERMCDVDSDGKLDLTRFVANDGQGCIDNCVINSIASVPEPGGGTYGVTIFPKCTSNAKVEEHGWVSLYLSSDYDSSAGCGCGNWADFDQGIKGACIDIGKAEIAENNNGFECLIYNDDGKKVYP